MNEPGSKLWRWFFHVFVLWRTGMTEPGHRSANTETKAGFKNKHQPSAYICILAILRRSLPICFALPLTYSNWKQTQKSSLFLSCFIQYRNCVSRSYCRGQNGSWTETVFSVRECLITRSYIGNPACSCVTSAGTNEASRNNEFQLIPRVLFWFEI